ncbi:hypothetical protein EDD11_002100 [Mortierella claussenii]|nr:hypothetical protein EDD11_002100 [Mortierella claussenii]
MNASSSAYAPANKSAHSPMAPVAYQPKTSHMSTPPSRPVPTSSPAPVPKPAAPTGPAPAPAPPLRRENSSPKIRKDLPPPNPIRNDISSSPQIRNEAPLSSPIARKEAALPTPPPPKAPVRRDTASSVKSQKETSSPVIKKEVPVPVRKDTPPQAQQPMRKNLISTSSPSSSAASRMANTSDRKPVVEIAQFAKEGFSHEECKGYLLILFVVVDLTQNLANASEETIRNFLQSLKDSKSLAAEDLQENVFKNYNEFVTISKEISALESDMQTLRGLLDDLKTTSDNLVDDDDEFLLTAGIEDSAPVVPKRMTVMVSSMSDLTSVWKAQMMALWEGIEGAQKMLPYHPKRHLIRESPSFVEVNTTTNKIKHPVHIVLMNDTILIATRKKKTAANSKYKLLGDRCWPLTGITIEDMKDTADIRNAFKITHGNEVFVYKTEKRQEKQTMLVNAKRTTDEMLAKSNESRKKGLSGFTPAMPNRAGMRFRASITTSQPDARWLAEFTDELDVMIAQRELDNAVAGIEKATVMLSQMSLPAAKLEETRKRLDERVSRLSRVIIVDLGQPHITQAAVKRNVGWLERLGCLDQARDVFLNNRTKVVRQRISQVKAKRDPVLHVEELAMIVFTSIKNTSQWFEMSFKDPQMTSALVKWAKQEIEYFAEFYKNIVFGGEQTNFQVIADCAKIATEQCNKLKETGLDLVFVLDTVLMPYLIETIAEHERRCLERMDAIIEHDDFMAMSGEELGSTTPLSASMIAFYTVMLQFVNNICLIGSLTLYSRIVDSVAILFKAYVNRTIQVYEEKGMTDDQRAVVNSNFQFISESFISRVIVQLKHRFDRQIPELEAVREELGAPGRSRNVIMMVSDGFGPASQTYGRSFWQYRNNFTAGHKTSLDDILVGASRTRSSSSLVTDSAAGATAFSCAMKSYNAAIGVDPEGAPCGTVLESAKQLGMLTGLVVTSRVTHATPAAFSAHVVHRDMEADIAVQQIGDYELGRQVDLMLGGGRCFFLPNTTEGSCRTDDRDLIKESRKYGWENVLLSGQEFESIIKSNNTLPLPLVGLFHSSHMNFEIDRRNNQEDEPSLHRMAREALRSLKAHAEDGQGFFLMIEGSRIDMGAHNNDPVAHVHEILEYHRTIQVVRKFVEENPDTVMISTSDHETGGFTLGLQADPRVYPEYLWRPEVIDRARVSTEILTKRLFEFHASESSRDTAMVGDSRRRRTEEFVKTEILDKGLGIKDPSTEEIELLSESEALPNDILRFLGHAISRRASLGWTTMGHTGVDVNLYAASSVEIGDKVLDRLRGNHENTEIGDFMTWYLDLDLASVTDRLIKSKDNWFKPQKSFTTTGHIRTMHEETGN